MAVSIIDSEMRENYDTSSSGSVMRIEPFGSLSRPLGLVVGMLYATSIWPSSLSSSRHEVEKKEREKAARLLEMPG